MNRLRVVSNFGDGDLWGGRNTHTRAREILRRPDAKGARHKSPSPKLETTRSLHNESVTREPKAFLYLDKRGLKGGGGN